MKNKITDLNNHLFSALEKLNDEEITPEQLNVEISRSKAISDIASQIIDANRVNIEAIKIMEKAGYDISKMDSVKQLGVKNPES